ncbi:putative geranylgeranyl pyrophosphate synthetase [Diaporthe ampelina]|uniref:Putative geranylgeranyl pyrophosphate synthetase n=1 Tax=Diaporthe ampelina TaxID=1214573 RepID=A0A0G2FLY6_9PEZI|nr:putative geranylgeranyl pyrophosphate synthetase [Diaporthe ampelina]
MARMPSYPFEPMFQSMSALNPDFRFDGVDLIVNRNSLNRLLKFTSGAVKQDFRLDLAMVHNTLVITPAWERVSEIIRDKSNHGREFEEMFLQRQRLQDSGSYHRAIRYNLGPLNCAVLSELDAALPGPAEAIASYGQGWDFCPQLSWVPSAKLSNEGQPNTRAEEILFGPRDPTASKEPRLRHQPRSKVIPKGAGTLSKDAAELSARVGSGINKVPQLWLGRVPFLVRGKYSSGLFTNVGVVNLATSFAAYENRMQDRLQRLVSLIGTLREAARDAATQRCVAICDKSVQPRALRIFNHHTIPPLPLPTDIRRHFWASREMGNQDSK